MSIPLVSIIIPCYKQAQYLDECLQSVLDQVYQNWECIIVNDGSPDNTERVAKEWTKRDHRFKYVFKENGGVSSTRNVGLKIAKGDYIQFLDSDDIILPEKLMKSVAIFQKETDLSIVITDFFYYYNTSRSEISHSSWKKNDPVDFCGVLLRWYDRPIPIHCGLFNKVYCANLVFKENLGGGEDWLWWLEVLKNKNSTYCIEEYLAGYNKMNKSSATTDIQYMHGSIIEAYIYAFTNTIPNELKFDFFVMALRFDNSIINKLCNDLNNEKLHFRLKSFLKTKLRSIIKCLKRS